MGVFPTGRDVLAAPDKGLSYGSRRDIGLVTLETSRASQQRKTGDPLTSGKDWWAGQEETRLNVSAGRRAGHGGVCVGGGRPFIGGQDGMHEAHSWEGTPPPSAVPPPLSRPAAHGPETKLGMGGDVWRGRMRHQWASDEASLRQPNSPGATRRSAAGCVEETPAPPVVGSARPLSTG